jgi:hypothetical protein
MGQVVPLAATGGNGQAGYGFWAMSGMLAYGVARLRL